MKSQAENLLEMLNESPGDGQHLSKIVLGDRQDVVRIVSAKNASEFEKALKAKKIKFKKGVIDLSKSIHKGAMLFGFRSKDEDEIDDILHDDLDIKNANPDSYDKDWSQAKLEAKGDDDLMVMLKSMKTKANKMTQMLMDSQGFARDMAKFGAKDHTKKFMTLEKSLSDYSLSLDKIIKQAAQK